MATKTQKKNCCVIILTEKKALIVTYYWPPAGGPGVQRWLKFVKYLPEFGWKPTVFIPENPSYPIVDETLENEVSKDLDLIKTKIWEPYQLAEIFGKDNKKFKAGQFDVGRNQTWKSKLSIWVRGNFFIPDARVFWVKPSVEFLKDYLHKNAVDVLITTGPPHSLHLIGLALKKEFPNLNWVADFRDPWTEISYYKHLKLTRSSDQKHRSLERQVFENADLTLATSYTDAENFIKKGATAQCITNGFDGKTAVIPKESDKFILSYIGVLEQLRNPDRLWNVLESLVKDNPDFAQDLAIEFAGRVDDKILDQLKASRLGEKIKELGYISHAESIEQMEKAHILLITNFPQENSRGIIPGKIFEYLASGNTILSFGPEKSDVEKILNETQAGAHFNYEAIGLEDFILKKYKDWKAGSLEKNPTASIEKFARRNLTKTLAEALNKLVKTG